jgi:serine/threonine-protein kinase HipA
LRLFRLLVQRIDRNGNQRLLFLSAMTLLGATDGDSKVGYLDLASFIKSYGSCPDSDLKELWKRIVFSMAVSNTDDHLRNHGFIWGTGGWRLSPMFDVNPVPYGDSLSLNVSIDVDLAIRKCRLFRNWAEPGQRDFTDDSGYGWFELAQGC